MPRELPDSKLENLVVNKSNQTQLFDRRDEFAPCNDVAPHIAHAEQAFEIIRLSRCRANHGLEGEEQPVLAQRRLHRSADCCTAVLPSVIDLPILIAH